MQRSKPAFDLSSVEAKSYIKLAADAVDVASESDYQSWVATSVRKFFPHEMFVAGVARRQGEGVALDNCLVSGYPTGYIEAVISRYGNLVCPALAAWFNHRNPQLLETRTVPSKERYIPHQLNEFNIRNIAAHGIFEPSSNAANYFSFSQIPDALNAHHSHLLEILLPHLNHAFLRVGANSNALQTLQPTENDYAEPFAIPHITAREAAVLRELYQEQSNRSIALALHRSPQTVKHQIHSLLLKLAASDRAEAVTMAIRLGLLPDRRSTKRPCK